MVRPMGLKHNKYIYVKRDDGWYVKVRVLNVRFHELKKKGERGKQIERAVFDVSDSSRYIVLPYKTMKPPRTAKIVKINELPPETSSIVNKV